MIHVINNSAGLHFVTDYKMDENDIVAIANNVLATPFFDISIKRQFGASTEPEAYFYKITPIEPKFVA